MKILMTNDDGIYGEGLIALAEELSGDHEVTVVAPDREQSATGHALTLQRPLRVAEARPGWYAVDGTPSDCVNIAVFGVLEDARPDLLVSGINLGLNLGDDVTYSGTVSAAMEGHLHGLPSIAFSQQVGEETDFARAARQAHAVIDALAQGEGLPNPLFLNVNFPARPARGFRWVRLGHRRYEQALKKKTDPLGRRYYWISGRPVWREEPGTDNEALMAGYATATPLRLDLTDHRLLAERAGLPEALETIDLEGLAG